MSFDAGLGLTVAHIDAWVYRDACEAEGTTLEEAWDALVAAGHDPDHMTRTDDYIHVTHVERPVTWIERN